MQRKILFLLLFVFSLPGFSLELKLDDKKIAVLKSDSSKDVKGKDVAKLEVLLLKLQKEVDELRVKVIILEDKLSKQSKSKRTSRHWGKKEKWTCYLQDSFNNTYSGEGKTRSEASVNALKSCRGLDCKSEKLKCSNK